VARAIVGASSALASLALVAGKALAATSLSVAQTTAGTLSVLVALTILIRGVNPSNLERAHTVRAITAIVGQTKAPVIKAVTNTIQLASAVAGAGVVATSLSGSEERKQQSSSNKHI
jgi:hypothetical protein